MPGSNSTTIRDTRPGAEPPAKGSRVGPTLDQARRLVLMVETEGISMAAAYRAVFPSRKVSNHGAQVMGGRILREYFDKYKDDWRELAKAAGIDPLRYFKKLDQLLEAKTYDEVVETKVKKVGGRVHRYLDRKSVLVEDGGTQLGAVKEVGRALGIGPQPGDNGNGGGANISVLVVANIEKRRQNGAIGVEYHPDE